MNEKQNITKERKQPSENPQSRNPYPDIHVSKWSTPDPLMKPPHSCPKAYHTYKSTVSSIPLPSESFIVPFEDCRYRCTLPIFDVGAFPVSEWGGRWGMDGADVGPRAYWIAWLRTEGKNVRQIFEKKKRRIEVRWDEVAEI